MAYMAANTTVNHESEDLSPRWASARLLGGLISLERNERSLSPEVFLAASGRTKEWLHAVEHGEVLPNASSLELLDASFFEHGGAMGLPMKLAELESNPYGKEAKRARKQLKLPHQHVSGPASGPNIGESAVWSFAED